MRQAVARTVNSVRAILVVATLALVGCHGTQPVPVEEASRPALGLMGTLPIYWPETDNFGELLDGTGETGWVRATLEQSYTLEPLDTLDAESLAGLERLLLAQPRALSPAENVALDNWVRAGGKLLLFADPLVTRHSRYGLGDSRRPQDVILLSPILQRWGLDLTFSEDQHRGHRLETAFGAGHPVDLAGTFALRPTEAPADCEIEGAGVAARCTIEKGRLVAFADTALLDEEAEAAGRALLEALLAQSFAQ